VLGRPVPDRVGQRELGSAVQQGSQDTGSVVRVRKSGKLCTDLVELMISEVVLDSENIQREVIWIVTSALRPEARLHHPNQFLCCFRLQFRKGAQSLESIGADQVRPGPPCIPLLFFNQRVEPGFPPLEEELLSVSIRRRVLDHTERPDERFEEAAMYVQTLVERFRSEPQECRNPINGFPAIRVIRVNRGCQHVE